jgi:NhaP-type Na+/H+ or K+/H+ antiporter
VVCAILTAFAFEWILEYKKIISFEGALLFGSIISATDPVAVVGMLKELGTDRRISSLIEGESLLNDGTAMAMFGIVLVSYS